MFAAGRSLERVEDRHTAGVEVVDVARHDRAPVDHGGRGDEDVCLGPDAPMRRQPSTQRTRSTRMGAVALFTCFLVGFVILTYVGTYLRGPNWDFYWRQSDWPIH